jgi:adenine-specific DNA-methyltransferase
MNYIEDISKVRLEKVVEGDQGGISKEVNWQGGGSFVYFELKKYNQYFVHKIMVANSKGELDEVYREMAKNAFLKFWFDKDEFERDENFRALDLDQRKELLISILDENQLYLNYADMRDSRYQVTEQEMALTDLFYGANNG